MTFELSTTSVFSLPPSVFDQEKDIDVKKFSSLSVQEFIKQCTYNEQTIPAGLDSENAIFELFQENPQGEYQDPRKLNYEQSKPYIEAFKRLKKNKDFKLFYEICLAGYVLALWRQRKRLEKADMELMVSKEILDKGKVVFGIMNQFNDIAKMQPPPQQATENVAN